MSKKHKFLFLCALVPLSLCAFAMNSFAGIGNPTAPVSSRAPLSPTTPVSRSNPGSFIPAPVQPNANQIVYGNVPGLAYFHGTLPYSAPGNIQGSLPSTSLDFFLRATAPAGRPFYSPTASSPSVLAAQAAQSEKIRTAASSAVSFPSIAMQPFAAATPPSQLSRLSLNRYQSSLLAGVSGYQIPRQFFTLQEKTNHPVLTPIEQIQKSLLEINKNLETSEQTAKNQTELPAVTQPEQITKPVQKPFTTDQLKEQLEQLNKMLEQQSTTENANKKIEETVKNYWSEKLKTGQASSESLLEKYKKLLAANVAAGGAKSVESKTGTEEPRSLPTSPQAEQILAQRSEEQMVEGYKLLKEQNLYKAADAFTMAALYKPSDPNGYAGKALALFAAGDYVYASQLIAVALELSPGYAKTNLNIAELFGPEFKLNERMADLQKYAAQNNSGQLYFLLAFVQFKTNQLPQARASIDQAVKLMPDNPPAKTLKSAIDSPAK
jgi:Flp pilus assembly protein TadD